MGRLARLMGRQTGPIGRRPTVFVLGGGGNLGAMQVGMLEALVERGILPDLVVGCSVGALNGAALALDPTPAGIQRLKDQWLSLDARDLCPPLRLPLPLQLVRRGSSLHGNDGLRRMIERFLDGRSFGDLTLPFQCVATSLERRRAVWFSEGPLLEPILASCAIPGVYPPVVIDGERYVDGGVVHDVPVTRALELGAGQLFVLYVGNLDRVRPPARRPIDMALEASWIARANWFHMVMESIPLGVQAIVVPGGETPLLRYDDFHMTAEMIETAHRAAAEFLDAQATEQPA